MLAATRRLVARFRVLFRILCFFTFPFLFFFSCSFFVSRHSCVVCSAEAPHFSVLLILRSVSSCFLCCTCSNSIFLKLLLGHSRGLRENAVAFNSWKTSRRLELVKLLLISKLMLRCLTALLPRSHSKHTKARAALSIIHRSDLLWCVVSDRIMARFILLSSWFVLSLTLFPFF